MDDQNAPKVTAPPRRYRSGRWPIRDIGSSKQPAQSEKNADRETGDIRPPDVSRD